MRGNAPVGDRGQTRHGPRRARELANVASAGEDAHGSAPPVLVQIDEIVPKVGELLLSLAFEAGEPGGGLFHGAPGCENPPVGVLRLGDAEVALDFELTQLDEQGARLVGQRLRLALERADSLGDTLRAGSCRGSLRVDEGQPDRDEHEHAAERSQQSARIIGVGRILGLDIGERRIGVAISDASGTLARPVGVLTIARLDAAALERTAQEARRLGAEDDDVTAVVVGLPRRLDGSPTDMTPRVEAFASQLGARLDLPVALQDERLTSREAEQRLAVREKDWRARKKKLDAAAAAIILQDYLDARDRAATSIPEPADF